MSINEGKWGHLVPDALVETIELGRDFVQRRRLFQRQTTAAVTALDGVSFKLDGGACLALVGPNGAGKSTLLRVLATLILPSRGTATVNGFDVERRPGNVRASIGYAGDADRSFFWPLTGLENLEFFGQLAGLSARDASNEARRWLGRVGLTTSAETRVSGYSAGMRQRLGLARALLHQPAVLLLDEPTSNLDAEYRQVAVEIIEESRSRGCGVIVATHDPGLVSAAATESLRLESGRIVPPESGLSPVRYRLHLARTGDVATDSGELVEVEDLGDGHALAAALSREIARGRDIVSVEHSGS